MKKKKVISACILLVFSLFNVSSFADTSISITDNNVVLSTDGSANTWGTLVVVKSGDSLENENIITMKQAFSDENGKYLFDFSVSDASGAENVNAKYDLYIKNGSDDIRKEEMYYATVNDRKELATALKNIGGTSQFIEIIENEENEIILRAIGFDFDKYSFVKSVSDGKEEFANVFINSVDKDDSSPEKITDALNKALLIELINIDSSKRDEYISELKLSFEDVLYNDIKDEKQKVFLTDYIYSNRKYTSVEKLVESYECANILYIINNTRFSAIEKNLKDYADRLDITSESVYKKYLNSKNKSDINEDIVELLKSSPAEDVDDLLAAIKEAVDNNLSKTGGSGSGGSSSGSSGGSGSGGGKTSSPTPVAPFVPTVKKQVFGDINNVLWAEDAINSLAEKGIVVGDENGNFNPDKTIKREEFVKMLVLATNMYNEKASCNFEDVIPGAWYYTYVASAFDEKLVYGVSEYEFGIGNNITRQDLAVMCYRAAKNAKEIKPVRDMVAFSDQSNISDYASEAVEALYRASVINGVGENEFAPMSAATRAQAAVIIYNLFIK